MDTATDLSKSIDLGGVFHDLCTKLQIKNPPAISWFSEKKGKFVGTYENGPHRIEISRAIPLESLNIIIVHELCHAVLQKVGYASHGHSAIFMATNDLMLTKAGLGDKESIESVAVANWNTWAPWPHWYRHVVSAQEISAQLQTKEMFLELNDSQTIARAVIDARPHNRWIPARFIYNWHEIIGDTRGKWFAIAHCSQILFFVSMGTLFLPFNFTKIVGQVGVFVSCVGWWVVGKVFNLDRNYTMPM